MSDKKEEKKDAGKIKNSIQLAVENNRLGNLKSTSQSSLSSKKTFTPTNVQRRAIGINQGKMKSEVSDLFKPSKPQEKKVKFLPNTTKKPKKLSSLDQRDDSFSFGGQGYQTPSFTDSYESYRPQSSNDEKKMTNSDYLENDFFKDVKIPPTSLPSLVEKKTVWEQSKDSSMIKEDELFFIQLPSSLPITSQKKVEKKQQEHGAEYDEIWMTDFQNTLTNIPKGYIGEMLVYKSGKRKLKLGNVLFDVVSGTESEMAENVACISSDSKKVYVLGDVSKRISCVPDLEACLNPK
eukprot:gene3306-5747_t